MNIYLIVGVVLGLIVFVVFLLPRMQKDASFAHKMKWMGFGILGLMAAVMLAIIVGMVLFPTKKPAASAHEPVPSMQSLLTDDSLRKEWLRKCDSSELASWPQREREDACLFVRNAQAQLNP